MAGGRVLSGLPCVVVGAVVLRTGQGIREGGQWLILRAGRALAHQRISPLTVTPRTERFGWRGLPPGPASGRRKVSAWSWSWCGGQGEVRSPFLLQEVSAGHFQVQPAEPAWQEGVWGHVQLACVAVCFRKRTGLMVPEILHGDRK